jgi:MerR family transcriptional regulator, light-induced transcriptional regulator
MVTETAYLHYLDALLEGNKGECKRIILELINHNTEIREIYSKIIQRSMYRIGKLWERNRACIGTEHLATQITHSMLGVIYSQISPVNKKGFSVLITCVDNEYHAIGAQIISDYFELQGWQTYFLGANPPHKNIIKMVEEKKPVLLGISNNFYMNVVKLLELIDNIKNIYPDQKIIIGGQAPCNCGCDEITKYKDVKYIDSFDELDAYLIANFE